MKGSENQQVVSETSLGRAEWVKPEIISFEPVNAARGINFRPQDGLSNLT